MALAQLNNTLDKRGIGRHQRLAVKTDIILKPRARVSAIRDAPFIDLYLVAPYARRAPLALRRNCAVWSGMCNFCTYHSFIQRVGFKCVFFGTFARHFL